jgi:hypothetical protein
MANPSDSVIQNLLPVQAYFAVDGTFQTFIGQGLPFYATLNPNQSGLAITNSTINSTTIGATTPSTAAFTSATVSSAPTSGNDVVNKTYLDYFAAGLSWKQPVLCATTANISLTGVQTLDGISAVAGSRVLVKNQTAAAENGIYISSASAWARSTDTNDWTELLSAIVFVESGNTLAGSAWYCTAQPGGTIGTTAVNWSNFAVASVYTAGTGLTLASYQFSITPVGTAGTYGSASQVPVLVTNASGQVTSVTNTSIAISGSQITSGTIGSSYLSGSYTGITGVGTLTAGTWNAGVIGVVYGGTGATTLTGYVKGSGTAALTASSTIPSSDITGLGTMSTQNANAVAITGGSAALTTLKTLGLTGYLYGNDTSAVTASTSIPTSALSGNFVSTFSAGTTGLTPSSNTTGAVTLDGTLNVANGGTGVTSSSGANSVVLRDANGNITTNCLFEGYASQAASGTTITLTAASAQNYQITGSGGQTIKLPNATTLPNGALFTFNNNQSSGAITVQNNSSTTVATINSGGYVTVVLLDNSIAAGSWDRHDSTPSNVSWSTNTLDYPGSITSATWNGNVIAINRGGTNGTATPTAGGIAYGSGTAYAFTSAGTSGQVLTSAGSGTPTWSTPVSYATVTDDTTTNATRYPLFASATTGNLTTEYTSSSKYQFNPSTGTLTTSALVTSGGTIDNNIIGNTTPVAGSFSTLQGGKNLANYIQAVGGATTVAPVVSAQGTDGNIPLVLQPKGTGALQAQLTDSTATGGNARGANAVDWQTSRGAASSVANGQYSVLGGGNNNKSTQYASIIAGGESNSNNSGAYTAILGGTSNIVTGTISSIAGGYGNTATGFYNFIGNGYSNSGTANAAVTTQATTTVTSGSTAVTLSGSNASIKVGQLITGTGINTFPHTYVAAISGTSLTLSQNATATGTPTLTFYTPHGVVVGGGNNQATGSYSFIGGGGDAGTSGNRNVASGDWSVVGGGRKNTASGIASFVGGGGVYQGNTGGSFPNLASGNHASVVGGLTNTASGESSFIGGGYSNQSSAIYSSILGGTSNISSGNGSSVLGGYNGTTRGISGNHVISACQSPITSANGVSQSAILILARQTTDATATVLCSDANAASGTNQVILPSNSAYYFRGEVVAGVTGAGDTKGWYVEGVIKRGAGVGTTALVGTATVTSLYADVGASTWAVTALADTTNGGLKITVTGQASTTIRWVAKISSVEMTF